jgi:outer membrane protein OmpA-like peptidoglycan-associated protein
MDEDLGAAAALKAQIERQVLRFILGTTQLVAGQNDALRQLVADLRQLDPLAVAAGKRARIEVIGHTDRSGVEEANLRLGQERAEYIQRVLTAQGINRARLTAVGVGTKEPLREELTEQDREFNRSVSFRVALIDSTEKRGPRP